MDIHKLVLASITLVFKHASLCSPRSQRCQCTVHCPCCTLIALLPLLLSSLFFFLCFSAYYSSLLTENVLIQWSQSFLSRSDFRIPSSLGGLQVYIVLCSYLASILTPVVFILLSSFFSSLLVSSLHAENNLITVITVFLSVGATSAHSTPFMG